MTAPQQMPGNGAGAGSGAIRVTPEIDLEALSPAPELGIWKGAHALGRLRGRVAYLATPYTEHADRGMADEACRMAAWWSGMLLAEGISVVSPIVVGHHASAVNGVLHGRTHEWWLARCWPLLEACAGVIVPDIEGWRRSRGIALEVGRALELRRPVVLVAATDWVEP